jgi:hypothetical protein
LKAKITLVVCAIVLLSAGKNAVPQGIEERKPSPEDQELAERRKKEFNKERRKAMIADADKILGLAGEIKESVTAEEAPSSAAVMAKLENVEKLARRIKNKMQDNANIADATTAAPARRARERAGRSHAPRPNF